MPAGHACCQSRLLRTPIHKLSPLGSRVNTRERNTAGLHRHRETILGRLRAGQPSLAHARHAFSLHARAGRQLAENRKGLMLLKPGAHKPVSKPPTTGLCSHICCHWQVLLMCWLQVWRERKTPPEPRPSTGQGDGAGDTARTGRAMLCSGCGEQHREASPAREGPQLPCTCQHGLSPAPRAFLACLLCVLLCSETCALLPATSLASLQ